MTKEELDALLQDKDINVTHFRKCGESYGVDNYSVDYVVNAPGLRLWGLFLCAYLSLIYAACKYRRATLMYNVEEW